MSRSQTFPRLTQAVIDEHRQIHFYLDQVGQTLERLRGGLADPEPMRRLAAQLEGLKERLVEHQHSEENGIFQAILEALPARRVEINRLTNQHEKIIEILEMARLHLEHGESSDAEHLGIDLERFLDMFRQHEEFEERLIAEALAQDESQVSD